VKVNHVRVATTDHVKFDDVKRWYEQNLQPDVINFDDPKPYEVYEKARWAGIFQLTSPGAQRLFVKAKPENIIDIATLTSIYRPGPLAANVDKLYLEAKNEGKQLEWGDKRINEILKKTYTCIIFQEQVMELAEKVAGFPKDKCDEVRRAIMKRSISGGEAAKKAAQETRDGFVKGCVNNGYTESVANNLYDKILYFAGYGFNKSHAVAYAIDSYWCAWLMTYFEEQWLTAYIESMLGNPDKKAKAFGEIKRLGYKIVPIDINEADLSWTVLPGKRFMPSLLSCKGLGKSGADEIIESRPYKSVEDMLWNPDGSWRPSKFNKKGLDALIKVGAFASLDCVGEGKVFNSYHHMHEVLIENADMLKKSPKRDPFEGKKAFYELARALGPEVEEWSRKELAELSLEIFGSIDVLALLDPAVLTKLDEKGVRSIDEWEGKDIYWFCIQAANPKLTKNRKKYLQFEGVGPAGKVYKISAWGWDGERTFDPYTVVIAEIDRNDFGASTVMWRLKEIS